MILGGKYIAVFVVVLLQTVILLVAGRLLFGAHWGAMGPVIALTLAGALVAASLGLADRVLRQDARPRPGAVSSAIFVFLGLVSGNFIGHGQHRRARSPSSAASARSGGCIEGWGHVLFGGSWANIALPLVAAVGFALVFFALATFFFRRRYA